MSTSACLLAGLHSVSVGVVLSVCLYACQSDSLTIRRPVNGVNIFNCFSVEEFCPAGAATEFEL